MTRIAIVAALATLACVFAAGLSTTVAAQNLGPPKPAFSICLDEKCAARCWVVDPKPNEITPITDCLKHCYRPCFPTLPIQPLEPLRWKWSPDPPDGIHKGEEK